MPSLLPAASAALRAVARLQQPPAEPHPGHAERFLPHGFCYLWDAPLLWTHLVADLLIGVAYVVIAVTLAHLVHRVRRDIPFSAVFVAFGVFIVACGLTHFMEVWTLWEPRYWLSAAVKVFELDFGRLSGRSGGSSACGSFPATKVSSSGTDRRSPMPRQTTA